MSEAQTDDLPESTYEFMVSYTGEDSNWAEWIAWQLRAEGYRIFLQAWNIPAGTNFVAAMDHAVKNAQRIVIVLSARYLRSAIAQSEWRPFFSQDPSGTWALILPVRIEPVEPVGLLVPISFVDLFDLSPMEARTALLSAARAKRGMPSAEPEFPGRSLKTASANSTAPPYPGKAKQALQLPKAYEIHKSELGGLRTLSAELSEFLLSQGYSEEDIKAFRISLHELVNNAATHAPNTSRIRVRVLEMPKEKYNYHEGVYVEVIDEGGGFDFERKLAQLEGELGLEQTEHGLLRTIRLSSALWQEKLKPHTMSLLKERTPNPVPVVFADSRVFPIVFDYGYEAIRLGSFVHTFYQFTGYLKRSPDFMALIFDPILRSSAKFVGVEVLGQGWTGVLQWEAVVNQLLAFVQRQPRFGRKLLLFADTAPGDHVRLRTYCKRHSIRLFENRVAVAKYLEKLKAN